MQNEELQKAPAEKKEKKEEKKTPSEVKKPVLSVKRQIIIETDGNMVTLIKAEVAGNLELKSILQTILESIK